jgi:hypothetical protein
MTDSVEFRISGLGNRLASTRDALAFGTEDGSDVVVRCPANSGSTINEKLVWLWGSLKHKRRVLKSLQADGAVLTCVCDLKAG